VFAPSDYTFELPPELIAREPAAARDASRLLHVTEAGPFGDLAFPDIVDLLPADAVVIANDTRVIPARVLGTKDTGGNVEVLFLEPERGDGDVPAGMASWRCLAKARRALRPGQRVNVPGAQIALEILSERAADGSLLVGAPADTFAFLEAHGRIPLPHYMERDATEADRTSYQTMFATNPGAIAAPTAGLHMTPAIAERLRARGIAIATLTLHVGWGTFAPVRVADVREHRMHRERFTIPEATAALVATGRPVVALGTTALRALEAAAISPRTLRTGPGATDIFIHPGARHTWQVVDHLVTNFHLPESTLLMLVCAFAGTDRVLAAYRHAVEARYRFFSYGDATLMHRC
jgi:S-adenosylmethionine:tRNA ribosyltransferase-isomerase